MIDGGVILYNRSRYKSFQFTMYHSIVCQAAGTCFCGTRAAMGADRRGETVKAEQSVFLPPRGHSRPLPKEVLQVPQVKRVLAEMPPFIQIANELADVEIVPPAAAQPPARAPARRRRAK